MPGSISTLGMFVYFFSNSLADVSGFALSAMVPGTLSVSWKRMTLLEVRK